MDTVEVAEVSLAEDDTVEGLVELEGDLHQVLLTLDVEAGDLGHVLLGLRPHGVSLRSRGLDVGRGGLAGDSHVVRDVSLLGRLGLIALLGRLRSGLVLGLPGRSGLGDILRPLGLGSRLVLRLGRRRSVLRLGLGLPLGRRGPGLGLVLGLLLGRRRWGRRLVLGLLGRRRPLLGWRRRLVLRLLGRLGLVLGLLRGRPVRLLRTARNHNGAGLHSDGQRHRDGSLGPGLGRGVVLSGDGGRGRAVTVNRGGLGSSILLSSLGNRGGGWGSLGAVITSASGGGGGLGRSSMVSVMMVMTTGSITLLGKHLGQLALLGNLVLIIFSEIYPVLGDVLGIFTCLHRDALHN